MNRSSASCRAGKRGATSVYNPSGSRVLHKTGYASSSSWKFWNIKAIRTGNYKVRYDIGQGNGHYLSFW